MKAPVIIPTLCRVTHLKKLLDSLKENLYSYETEIFISVDYPPSDIYQKKYSEMILFLQNYDFSVFKNVSIFYQKENLGFIDNNLFLIDKIKEKYDRYIFTEDDNVFSRNFLEYMNRCLDLYENNDYIYSINSCNDYCSGVFNESVGYSKLFTPYGVGYWLKKDNLIADLENVIFDKKNFHLKSLRKLYKKNSILTYIYLTEIVFRDDGFFYNNCKLWKCDTVISIYFYLTDKYCVIPKISKSLTNGNDGSGNNMPKLDIKKPTLDSNISFDAFMQ